MTEITKDTLKLLIIPTWDGDLPSKVTRDELVRQGLVERHDGWNWLTNEGLKLV